MLSLFEKVPEMNGAGPYHLQLVIISTSKIDVHNTETEFRHCLNDLNSMNKIPCCFHLTSSPTSTPIFCIFK